jgi:hypothetical protein
MRAVLQRCPPNRVNPKLLLWSHYGKKHEGIRIGFEFPGPFDVPFQLSAIEYQEKRVQVVFWFLDVCNG